MAQNRNAAILKLLRWFTGEDQARKGRKRLTMSPHPGGEIYKCGKNGEAETQREISMHLEIIHRAKHAKHSHSDKLATNSEGSANALFKATPNIIPSNFKSIDSILPSNKLSVSFSLKPPVRLLLKSRSLRKENPPLLSQHLWKNWWVK